mgnify:CR=1 FL=1
MNQRTTFESALDFLSKLKGECSPEQYHRFLEFMHEFKSGSGSISSIVSQVSELFKDKPELISVFQTFLPESMSSSSSTTTLPPLTIDSISRISRGESIQTPFFVRVSGIRELKPVAPSSPSPSRIRALISDGSSSIACLFAVQLNDFIFSNVVDGSIIEILEFVSTEIPQKDSEPRKIVIIGRIGKSSNPSGKTIEFVQSPPPPPSPVVIRPFQPVQEIQFSTISNLNPYMSRWKVKVLVTKVETIKFFFNKRSKTKGCTFGCDLADETAEIHLVAFDAEAHHFGKLIQVDHLYLIEQASIKISNQKFTLIKNDYEICLNKMSKVTEFFP